MKMRDLVGREIKIGEKEGEITKILGCSNYLVEFFNINDGKCVIHVDEIDKYLI